MKTTPTIEHLPTDPLAEVKAAHARGEKIQVRSRMGSTDWLSCVLPPSWSSSCEYRIAPSPVPEGKLSDELKRLQSASRMSTADMDALKDQLATLRAENAKQDEEIARLHEDLRSAAAVIGQKIEGQLLHAYMEHQFPATQGHIPLKKFYQSLGSELVNIAAVLPPPAPTTEETERAEFEKYWTQRCADTSSHKTSLKAAAFDIWQASHASKEAQP